MFAIQHSSYRRFAAVRSSMSPCNSMFALVFMPAYPRYSRYLSMRPVRRFNVCQRRHVRRFALQKLSNVCWRLHGRRFSSCSTFVNALRSSMCSMSIFINVYIRRCDTCLLMLIRFGRGILQWYHICSSFRCLCALVNDRLRVDTFVRAHRRSALMLALLPSLGV